jgi:hypothetical protein
MWLLSAAIFAGCKWLTWRRTVAPGAQWWQHAGYLLAWPGLDAAAFLSPKRLLARERVHASEWGIGALRLVIGVTLFWVVAGWVSDDHKIIVGWLGMVGLILMLHFGAFHLLSCAWRRLGIDARPLMNRPLSSVSVGEFWGRRWNTAFRDLTHRFLFRPLNSKLGPRWAILAGFVFSGVIHDVVISVPAGGGYGGPTLFFGTQAAAMFAERSRVGRAIGLGRGGRGRLFTMLTLILPAYVLFHPPFVRNIIVPFMHALGVH